MTRLIYFLSLLFLSFSMNAQLDPVSWTTSSNKLDDGTYEVVFTATMDGDWVLYSQHTDPDGPVPTSFSFDQEACLDGEVIEKSASVSKYSDLFMVDVIKFEKESIFVQSLKPTCSGTIKASIEYMTCDGERCLPPKLVEFELDLD